MCMKKHYKLCLSLFMAYGIYNSASAQTAIGSSQSLLKDLKSTTVASGSNARTAATPIELQVSGSKRFSGKVNFKKSGKNSEYVNGELNGVSGSSFFLEVSDKEVKGHILLKDTKEAYEYYSDESGNAYVKPVDINGVICIDLENTPPKEQSNQRTEVAEIGQAVLNLQSYSGAAGCVFLDFDGYNMPAGNLWNNGKAINAAASGMSDAAIREHWEVVSEDYRPFNVNVTTSQSVFNSYPKNRRMRVVVTPTNTAAPGAGGVAYIGSFNWDNDVPCWVFITSGKSGGEASSHEVGHTFGLGHDGRTSPAEGYFQGHGDWAPIMGVGYYKPISQWSKGEYNNANNKEDDLAKISSSTYGVGYRADDYGNNTANAATLSYSSSGAVTAKNGIITTTGDVDFFTFTTGGGNITLNVNTVSRHGNLDILVRLFNASGTQIGSFNPAGLNATVTASLAAGKYFISVDGTGAGNPATNGYSDYASLGSYTITGTIPPGTVVTPSGPVAVTVYKDCSYGGYAIGLAEGDYTLAQLQAKGISNDDISSLKVVQGYKVTLYNNDNFGGSTYTATADNSCLVSNNFNDLASSLKIVANGVTNLAGTYNIQNRNSNLYLAVSGASTSDGAAIVQQALNSNATNQQFELTHLGNGAYRITAKNSGKALDIVGVNTADGAKLNQWTYVEGKNQQFIAIDMGGYYKFMAKHSNKILELLGGTKTSGAQVNQWPNHSGNNGQWKLSKVTVTPTATSTVIQAENWSTMSGVQNEATTDAGGGQNVGYIDNTDWMAYNNINFPTSGKYLVEYRVASVNGGKLSLDLNAGTIQLGSVNVPATGGWQNWTTISHVVTVNAGTYNLGIYAQTGGWNINWIKITKQSAAFAATAAAEGSLDEVALEQIITLFPNPASEALNISANADLTGSTATIVDVMGNVVLVATTYASENTLDIHSLPAGVYSVIITQTSGAQTTKRFIKQ